MGVCLADERSSKFTSTSFEGLFWRLRRQDITSRGSIRASSCSLADVSIMHQNKQCSSFSENFWFASSLRCFLLSSCDILISLFGLHFTNNRGKLSLFYDTYISLLMSRPFSCKIYCCTASAFLLRSFIIATFYFISSCISFCLSPTVVLSLLRSSSAQ